MNNGELIKINMNPHISNLRKCSGCYTNFNGKYYEKHNFELGVFHQFGASYKEFENGAGNYSTAIVELPDGKIVEAIVSSIKFLDLD